MSIDLQYLRLPVKGTGAPIKVNGEWIPDPFRPAIPNEPKKDLDLFTDFSVYYYPLGEKLPHEFCIVKSWNQVKEFPQSVKNMEIFTKDFENDLSWLFSNLKMEGNFPFVEGVDPTEGWETCPSGTIIPNACSDLSWNSFAGGWRVMNTVAHTGIVSVRQNNAAVGRKILYADAGTSNGGYIESWVYTTNATTPDMGVAYWIDVNNSYRAYLYPSTNRCRLMERFAAADNLLSDVAYVSAPGTWYQIRLDTNVVATPDQIRVTVGGVVQINWTNTGGNLGPGYAALYGNDKNPQYFDDIDTDIGPAVGGGLSDVPHVRQAMACLGVTV